MSQMPILCRTSARLSAATSSAQRQQLLQDSVTQLNDSSQQLLQAIVDWSLLDLRAEQVSDVYVEFCNKFNTAVDAFKQHHVEIKDVSSVPQDLREVLEQCLSQEASPQRLVTYIPKIREILKVVEKGLHFVPETDANTNARNVRGQTHRERPMTLESAVTQFLVSIKDLLNNITAWSERTKTQDDVYNAFEEFHGLFTHVIQVFGNFNVGLASMLQIPQQMSDSLDVVLSGEQSKEGMTSSMGPLRQLVQELLLTLRQAQAEYRQRTRFLVRYR